jgi:hypothetical protein
LLNEKNGKLLKSRVGKSLNERIKSTQGSILNLLAVFVAQSYQGKLIDMQIQLLDKIHHCYMQYGNLSLYQDHGPLEQVGGHGIPIYDHSESKRVSLSNKFWGELEEEICKSQKKESSPTCNLM